MEDLQIVQEIAKKNNISSTIIDELTDFIYAEQTGRLPHGLIEQTNPPTPTSNPTSTQSPTIQLLFWSVPDTTGGWLYMGCAGLFISLTAIFILTFNVTQDKVKGKNARAVLQKGILSAPAWIFGGIATALILESQTSFSPNFTQGIIVLIVIASIVLAALFVYRKVNKKSIIGVIVANYQ